MDIEILNNHWQLIVTLCLIIAGGFRFYYANQSLRERVTKLEVKMKENYAADGEVATRIGKMETSLETLVKAVKAILKQLKIPDIL